jgi:iron complex transport system substrate-binding protein
MYKWKYLKTFILTSLVLTSCGSNNTNLRIVSLSTTHSEILLGLGAEDIVVGVDMFVVLDNSNSIQRIDSFKNSIEDILSLQPTHVLMAFPNDELRKELLNNNVQTLLLLPARNIEDVYRQIILISELVEKQEKALEIVSIMKKEMELIIRDSEPNGKRIYHELGYSYGIYSVNINSLVGSFYEILGFRNIANNIPSKFGGGYPEVQEETILARDPEIIILGHKEALNSDPRNRPNWRSISAVQTDDILYLDENLANNWGIYSVELLRTIAVETEVLVLKQNKITNKDYWHIYIFTIPILLLIMKAKRKRKENR